MHYSKVFILGSNSFCLHTLHALCFFPFLWWVCFPLGLHLWLFSEPRSGNVRKNKTRPVTAMLLFGAEIPSQSLFSVPLRFLLCLFYSNEVFGCSSRRSRKKYEFIPFSIQLFRYSTIVCVSLHQKKANL